MMQAAWNLSATFFVLMVIAWAVLIALYLGRRSS